MAANILRSLDPIRKGVMTAIDKQPEILMDFASAVEEEQHLNDLEEFTDNLTAQRDRYSEFYKLLLGAKVEDEDMQKEIEEQSGKDAENLMVVDSVFAKCTTAIKRITRKRTYSMSNGRDSALSASTGATPVKLPKLQLVSFDGNVLKWSEFWDSFKASVHQNVGLNEIDKMNYLKAHLGGSAKEAIAGLSSTAANYENAIKILERRFGNKRVIVNAHYSALANLAPAQNQKDKLREIFDVIEQHLNSLEALGENLNNSQMASTIKSKLPIGVIIRLEEQEGSELWKVDQLRDRIHTYLSIRESAEQGRILSAKLDSPTVKPKGHRSGGFHHEPLHSTTEALLTTANSPKKCAFCKIDGHWSSECRRYPTAESRKKQIHGHCFNCLSDGHHLDQCKRIKACFYCKRVKHHHSSLCPKQFPTTGLSSTATAVTSEAIKDAPAYQNTSTLLAHGESVLLQTAKTKILSSDGKIESDARIVLDSCSHRSYITKALAKRLKLKPIMINRLEVGTFGSSSTNYHNSELVELKIRVMDGSYVSIEANVIPTITAGLSRQPINIDHYGKLYGSLPLADDLPLEHEVVIPDFLLGNDYYWEFVTQEKILLDVGLFLIGSKFGWILTGRQKSASPSTVGASTLLVCSRGFTELSLDD